MILLIKHDSWSDGGNSNSDTAVACLLQSHPKKPWIQIQTVHFVEHVLSYATQSKIV